MADAIV